MSTRRALLPMVVWLLWGTVWSGARQAPLAVVSVTPQGELTQLADANDVRVVFSEPMIVLGGPAATEQPSWFTITPAIPGYYFWSGTRTLIFSPDPATPFPYATRFTIRVDGAAASVAGHTLGSAMTVGFSTPTVRLLATMLRRENGRFDDPALLTIRFNQPVRAADVAAHTHLTLSPHDWTPPVMQADARARLETTDPAGLAAFDAKVAAAARIAASSDPIGIRLAAPTDRPAPEISAEIALETTTAPPSGGWLRITIDGAMPSPAGPERHAAQSADQRVEPAFFIDGFPCVDGCDPLGFNPLRLRASASPGALAAATTITDVTDPAADIRISPTSAFSRSDAVSTASLIDLGFDPQPAMTTWAVHVDGTLQASDGQTLGYPWLGLVRTVHTYATAAMSGGVWESAGGPRIPLSTRNLFDVREWIAPVRASEIMPRLVALRSAARLSPVGALETVPLTIVPDLSEAHGLDLTKMLSPAGTGLVSLAFQPGRHVEPTAAPNRPSVIAQSLIQVTNLGLSVKDSPNGTLVFVTRLDSATPVSGAHVAIINDSNQRLWSGDTGVDGVVMAPALALRPTSGTGYRPQPVFIVTAEKDADVAYVGSDWNSTAPPFMSGVNYTLADGPTLRGEIFTDRGVYQQGEELRIKAVVRRDALDGTAPVPAGTHLFARIRDARGRQVDTRTLDANRWSSIDWTWHVAADAPLGNYQVDVSTDPPPADLRRAWTHTVSGRFLVAAFRRPDFRVETSVAADPPVLGSTLHAVVTAKYLFGQALASRPVRWVATHNPAISIPPAIRQKFPAETYAFGYVPDPLVRAASTPTTKTETLDANGRLDVEIPTTAGDDFAMSYLIDGDVTSVSEQHIAANASIVVHSASIYVGVKRPPMFVNVKDGLNTEVVVSDLAGGRVADVPVRVSLVREEWKYVAHPIAASTPGVVRFVSAYSGDVGNWQRQETPMGNWTVRSAAQAVKLAVPLTDGGSFILRAEARDSAGRPTRTDAPLYGIGGGRSSWRVQGNVITLVPERVTWKPGETARVLVQSPWEQATALVTVEREGVRRYQEVAIHSTQDTVDVPLTDGDVPNVFVSVLLVKGRTSDALGPDGSDVAQPAFRVGYTALTIDDASRRLKVDVTSDHEEYLPHASAKLSVAVHDAAGQLRSAEVAFWAVDYGLLSLTNYKTPDVLAAIYAARSLQVSTEDTRERMIGRKPIVVETMGFGTGTGGGFGGGAMSQNALDYVSFVQGLPQETIAVSPPLKGDIPVRKDFRPLVFWLGSTSTGADGRASTTVTLPDSLTTYRIMAVADEAQRFGNGEREIRVTKPVTLLPAFPRFLSRGDHASFGATVTNGRTTGGDAVVTVRSLDGAALAFEPATVRTLHLPPGTSAPVRFDAVATGIAPVRVQMSVTLGADTDAFETTLPVTLSSRLQTVATYGDTTSTAIERLMLPAGLVPGVGQLSVTLASTALVGLNESARFVDEYPYESAEAKASRALALMLTSDLDTAFARPGSTPVASHAAARQALDALYGFQCGDGGFAFWPGECRTESAYLTAYVLDVMHEGTRQNLPARDAAVLSALNYLQTQLGQPPPEIQWRPAWSASQAYAVKVLAEWGRADTAQMATLSSDVESLPVFALSYLADAFADAGDRGPRYQDIVRRVTNSLRVEGDQAHVEEVDDDGLLWLWDSNVRATAVVLDGFARRKDDQALVAPLARWLLAARVNGRWGTTYENATALGALVSYYRTFEADVPHMNAAITLGARSLGTAAFEGRSTSSQEFQVAMPDVVKQMAGVERDLQITRTGTGRMYYTTRLQYLAPEPATPDDRGLHIERRYTPYVPPVDGVTTLAPAATSFALGDLIRVVVTLTLPAEGKFMVVDDRLPAGFEPIDASLSTTARDLVTQATTNGPNRNVFSWWRQGGFDHIEKHDDRVLAFATRLAAGPHEFTYLVRATTAGTFGAAGARAEAMYAPEVSGRSAAASVTIR